ncbi:hypothetical protein [Nonomuraea wenchangensis]|uniref:Uncharacterized protein n=1 Tax=Nonomuraea wenchangensis TaxID=568860 RepID=A0A1I0F0F1_9ACTN|nr:hypothetical protein [Nonomuraea wenchangensis]SET51409.1 hypothetical protein SAMN05421811_103277 [Nonomuraea wenchangensis]
MTSLLPCCQQAALDGSTPADHYRVCDARAEDPQDEVLFDLPDPKTAAPVTPKGAADA